MVIPLFVRLVARRFEVKSLKIYFTRTKLRGGGPAREEVGAEDELDVRPDLLPVQAVRLRDAVPRFFFLRFSFFFSLFSSRSFTLADLCRFDKFGKCH